MKYLMTALAGFCLLCLIPGGAAAGEYRLVIARQTVTVAGKPIEKITVNGSIPGPVLRFKEGEEAVIHVENRMDEPTSVHWHGVLLPGFMDGAPGFNGFAGIAPGETFTYRFPVRQAGTYWYHAHTMGQEQDGLYAGMIFEPGDEDPVKADRDYVVLLSDIHKHSAARIMANLKKSSDYYQWRRETVFDRHKDDRDWARMRMLATDLSDVTGYQFLTNGMTGAQNWTGLFRKGEKVRLRFINAAAMTMWDVRIPGLEMTVVAADGQNVEPVAVDEFRFGNAETYDVIVTPEEDKAYTIVAESIDREGFALSTLAPREGMRGEMPVHRPRARLTMGDMNMAEMMKDDPHMDMSGMEMESGWARTFAPEGARVLDYADLKSLRPQGDARPPTRDIEIRLGGNMERYIWTMNGRKFDAGVKIPAAFGERVRISYVNETMMAHPIHLHGMFVQLENGQGPERMPSKHTVIVPPGQTVSVLLTASEPGDWPFHCHLFFHMMSGMMTTLSVPGPGAGPGAGVLPAEAPKKTDGGGHHAH